MDSRQAVEDAFQSVRAFIQGSSLAEYQAGDPLRKAIEKDRERKLAVLRRLETECFSELVDMSKKGANPTIILRILIDHDQEMLELEQRRVKEVPEKVRKCVPLARKAMEAIQDAEIAMRAWPNHTLDSQRTQGEMMDLIDGLERFVKDADRLGLANKNIGPPRQYDWLWPAFILARYFRERTDGPNWPIIVKLLDASNTEWALNVDQVSKRVNAANDMDVALRLASYEQELEDRKGLVPFDKGWIRL